MGCVGCVGCGRKEERGGRIDRDLIWKKEMIDIDRHT